MRLAFTSIGMVCLAATMAFAGKPWRPAIQQLADEAELIVIGKVLAIQPSRIIDSEGRRFALAEISSSETLKGQTRDLIRVAVEALPRYDERGVPIPMSSAWRYELQPGDHEYLLFLSRPGVADATYFVPAHDGSGIIDLRPGQPNSLPNAVKDLREALRKGRAK
jgi:hypothetical protein